jgi:hypothetical protein
MIGRATGSFHPVSIQHSQRSLNDFDRLHLVDIGIAAMLPPFIHFSLTVVCALQAIDVEANFTEHIIGGDDF